jgi:hypothetical protein
MKYFPNPSDLSESELKALFYLNRDNDFSEFKQILFYCKKIINDTLINESVNGQSNTLFRHVGALAFILEFGEFMKEVETLTKGTI